MESSQHVRRVDQYHLRIKVSPRRNSNKPFNELKRNESEKLSRGSHDDQDTSNTLPRIRNRSSYLRYCVCRSVLSWTSFNRTYLAIRRTAMSEAIIAGRHIVGGHIHQKERRSYNDGKGVAKQLRRIQRRDARKFGSRQNKSEAKIL